MTEFSEPVDFLVVDFREKKASCIHISKKNAECMRPRFFMLFFLLFCLVFVEVDKTAGFYGFFFNWSERRNVQVNLPDFFAKNVGRDFVHFFRFYDVQNVWNKNVCTIVKLWFIIQQERNHSPVYYI